MSIYYGTIRVVRIETEVAYDGHLLEKVYVEDDETATTLIGPGFLLLGEQTPRDIEVDDVLECTYSAGSTSGGYLIRWPICEGCGHHRRPWKGGSLCEPCTDKQEQDADDQAFYRWYGCSPYEH